MFILFEVASHDIVGWLAVMLGRLVAVNGESLVFKEGDIVFVGGCECLASHGVYMYVTGGAIRVATDVGGGVAGLLSEMLETSLLGLLCGRPAS